MHQYLSHGVHFIKSVCEDLTGKYLEEISGITALTTAVDMDMVDACDFDEDF